jgi:hypothetical protein
LSSSAERAVCGSNRSRAWNSTLLAICTVVSGVRSSCETSDTNRCCSRDRFSSRRIWLCKLAAIWLNDVLRRAMSSSPLTCMRCSRLPDAYRSAIRRASRTGFSTWRDTSHATPPTISTIARPPSSSA